MSRRVSRGVAALVVVLGVSVVGVPPASAGPVTPAAPAAPSAPGVDPNASDDPGPASGPAVPALAPTAGGAVAEPVRIAPVPGGDPGAGATITGHWFRASPDAAAGGPRGAVLLLHGCGGAYRTAAAGTPADAPRRLDTRLAEVVDLARDAGWHALVVDSFGPRGERELCTRRLGERRITQRHRRQDALAALAWLAGRPEVDAARLGLVGWSHGGSTVLAAVDASHEAVASAPVRPAFALAHYPGCSDAAARAWRPTAPVWLLVGEADDWTPPRPCAALASRDPGADPAVTVVTYAGAVHGFDGRSPVRRRTDVPNGVVPGAGVWVGRQDAAATDARARLAALLGAPARPR